MKVSIQEKIDQIKKVAHLSKGKETRVVKVAHPRIDSLSKSIRNEKEAELFYSELNHLIQQAKELK